MVPIPACLPEEPCRASLVASGCRRLYRQLVDLLLGPGHPPILQCSMPTSPSSLACHPHAPRAVGATEHQQLDTGQPAHTHAYTRTHTCSHMLNTARHTPGELLGNSSMMLASMRTWLHTHTCSRTPHAACCMPGELLAIGNVMLTSTHACMLTHATHCMLHAR